MDAPKLKNDNVLEDENNFDPRLSRWIGFSYRDLLANRGGYLSKSQMQALKSSVLRRNGMYILGAFIFSPIELLVVLVMAFSSQNEIFAVMVCLAVSSVLLVHNVVSALSTWLYLRADVQENQVNSVEGRMDFTETKGRHPSYTMRVEEEPFDVSYEVWCAFLRGQDYRVYYTPRSKVILSAEPLKAKR